MLDINLGNKTLAVSVLVALILSYGMINFDSRNDATRSVPVSISAEQAALPSDTTEINAVAQADNQSPADTDASLSSSERRALRRHKNL